MVKHLTTIPRCFARILCLLIIPVSAAYAQPEDERQFLLMYFTEEELVVESPTRSPKPLSQVAENVTVVTADDIQLMNAHTVADVLNTITGVQVYSASLGSPGASALAFIQGSDQKHVAVFIDGAPVNNLGDNVTDIASLPVQNIEKIEIIRGPASSAWGSSLGGVVNIITKSRRTAEGAGGMASASYGKQNTGDIRAETSGRNGALGYYLNAGRLQTDGLTPNVDVSSKNAYAKLAYDVTEKTRIQFALSYNQGSRGDGAVPDFDLSFGDEFWNMRSTVLLKTAIDKKTDMRFSFWSVRQRFDLGTFQLSTGTALSTDYYNDEGYGQSAELSSKINSHILVFGVDHDSRSLTSSAISGGEQAIRKAAVYLNDTISFADLSITPGIRYDNTNTNGAFTSPSLGVTYKLTETTIVRAYGASGFSIPPLAFTYGDNQIIAANPNLKMERVLSYQVGAETAALKYFWLKLSAFRHEIRDAISMVDVPGPYSQAAVNSERQRRMGVDAEIKSAPVYNTSLTAGAEYISAKDLNNNATLLNIPKYIYDIGLVYDDAQTFRASLKGRYTDWQADRALPEYQGNYGNFVVDLNIVGRIYNTPATSLEAFATAHNIFNGEQYLVTYFKNPARWVEAGIRYQF